MERETSLKEHLFNLENMLLKPDIRTTPKEIEKLLSDDFFEFGSSGRVWHKQDCLGLNGMEIVQMTISQFEIHSLSEGVVLTTYQIYDDKKLQKTLRSSIWKLNEDQWQMVFHQGTPIKT